MSLDALKAEIAVKRKAASNEDIPGRPSKYMRRGELEKLREKSEEKQKPKDAKPKEVKENAKLQSGEVSADTFCMLLLTFS